MSDIATDPTMDLRPLGRAAQRLFSATQWLFALALAFAMVMGGAAISGEIADYATDIANQIVRFLLLGGLLFYAVLFAIMGYRRRYWRGAAVASLLLGAALVITMGLAVAMTEPEAGDAPPDYVNRAVAALVILAAPVFWFIRQALGARRLLNAPWDGATGGLAAAMERAETAFAAQAAAGHGARSRSGWLGLLLKSAGLLGVGALTVSFFAGLALPETGAEQTMDVLAGVMTAGLLGAPLFALMIAYGRRLQQPDAGRLLAADERAPVLLLRSFGDDHAALSGVNAFKRLLYFGFYGRIRLEEAIADELGRLGPFIAIGQPGERLPALGAARAYFSDEEWKEKVLDWMGRARLIVLIGGATPWVGWELRQIVEQGALDRLALLLPPKRSDDDAAARWAALRDALSGAPWAGRLSSEEVEDAIAIFTDRSGRLAVLRSAKPRQTDYEIAVRLIAAEKFAPSEPVRPRPVAAASAA